MSLRAATSPDALQPDRVLDAIRGATNAAQADVRKAAPLSGRLTGAIADSDATRSPRSIGRLLNAFFSSVSARTPALPYAHLLVLRSCDRGWRRARDPVGRASARGCSQAHTLWRPHALGEKKTLQIGMHGVVLFADDVPARLRLPSGSPRFRLEQVGFGDALGRPNELLPPPPKGLRQKYFVPPDAARYVHPRLRCGERRRSVGTWTAASRRFIRRQERARRCKPAR